VNHKYAESLSVFGRW